MYIFIKNLHKPNKINLLTNSELAGNPEQSKTYKMSEFDFEGQNIKEKRKKCSKYLKIY